MTLQNTNVGVAERVGSVVAGGILVARLLRDRSLGSVASATLGADLIYRGATGHCQVYDLLGVNTARNDKPGAQVQESAPGVRRSITIGRPAQELFHFWLNPHNLARIVAHFAQVSLMDGESITHWRVRGPLKQVLQWESQTIEEEPGRTLTWASLPGTELPNRGRIDFTPAPDGKGTEVSLQMLFEPPLGAAGRQFMRVLKKVPRGIAGTTLRRFKSLVETGEIPTLENNPSGRGKSDAV